MDLYGALGFGRRRRRRHHKSDIFATSVLFPLHFLFVFASPPFPLADSTNNSSRTTCPSNVCLNGGACFLNNINAEGTKEFECECRDGFAGDLCELRCSLSCRNGGKCKKSEAKEEWCECAPGFGSALCADRLEEEDCLQTGCASPNVCLTDPSTGNSQCELDHCVRWGVSPCANNGTCRPAKDDFFCDCPPGFQGRQCAEDVDECAEGERGQPMCHNGGTCENAKGTFRCRCAPGHNGPLCELPVGACVRQPCGGRGECRELANGDHICHCFANFTGKNCEQDHSPPPPPQCALPFVSMSRVNGTSGLTTVQCECPPGKAGNQCELVETDCDVPERGKGCQNGGECIRLEKRAFCICPTGFGGPNCQNVESFNGERAIDEAQECTVKGRLCLNGGKCVFAREGHGHGNGQQTYCKCKGEFIGTWCDRPLRLTAGRSKNNNNNDRMTTPVIGEEKETGEGPIASCEPNPCQNGGKCLIAASGPEQRHRCECPFGTFTGHLCQLPCEHCARGQGCAESVQEPGRVECFQTADRRTSPTPEANVEEEEMGENEDGDNQSDSRDGNGTGPLASYDIFAPADNAQNGTSLADANNTWTNISDCSDCVHALKCLQSEGRIRCLCAPDYAGPLCDMKRTPCASLDCSPKPGQTCLLSRMAAAGHPLPLGGDQQDGPTCACPPGTSGPRCGRPNSMTFVANTSVILLQQQITGGRGGGAKAGAQRGRANRQQGTMAADYRLRLTFRTTLPEAHLASGETLLGQTEFSLLLRHGKLYLQDGNNQSQGNSLDSAVQLNDDDWYSVTLWANKAKGTGLELRHSESGFLLARRILSGSRLFAVWNTRLGHRGHSSFFLGCMRDISLNGGSPVEAEDERAIGIVPGCHREPQCPEKESKCSNGGECVDLWDKFVCKCPRPFMPPFCDQKLLEATFGHGNAPSNAIYAMNSNEKSSLEQETRISFLLRTHGQRNAPLFYLGQLSNGPEMETSTFLAAELDEGKPRVNVRLGGKMVFSLGSPAEVDDNRVHLVEIERKGNDILLLVDGKAEPLLRLARPFAHPLLSDQLVIGARPEPNVAPMEAFGKNVTASSRSTFFFRGTLQDFRINDQFVPFDDFGEKYKKSTFGQKLSDQNLLQGTVSDNVCASGQIDGPESANAADESKGPQPLCGQHGQCRNTFNDFECDCEQGWMGRHCHVRDFCGANSQSESAPGICPMGTECQNVDGEAFVCKSTATLTQNSALRYILRNGTAGRTPVAGGGRTDTNLSMELRTRSQNAHLIKLQSSSESLSLQLRNGRLQLVSSISASNLSSSHSAISSGKTWSLDYNISLADGQWHKLKVVEQGNQQKEGKWPLLVSVDGRENSLISGEQQLAEYSLKTWLAGGQARISIGRVREHQGFKGCVRHVSVGWLPPLSFLSAHEAPQMAVALEQSSSTAHFSLQKKENVRRTIGGCESTDICAERPCLNGGTCADQFDAMECRCAAGFEGTFCEINRDECHSMDGHAECGQHGKCVDQVNGFRCDCFPGFSGPKCANVEDLCRPGTCKNGGKCRMDSGNGTAECDCPSKFMGHWCQLEATVKCAEKPCQNGGLCTQSAHGQITCWCAPGFAGPLCEIQIDPCSGLPCQNGGKCVWSPPRAPAATVGPSSNSNAPDSHQSSPSAFDFHCECPPEYGGLLCEHSADHCKSGAENRSCSGNGRCQNVWAGHRCICGAGWRGRECSTRVDICAEELPCLNGGTCLAGDRQQTGNGPIDFVCKCPPFHLGDRCEIAGVCADNPCQNGGECEQKSSTDFVCRCPHGYQGTSCERRVDYCDTEPCQNGATCIPQLGDFQCQCIPGFTGKKCEIDVDECALPQSPSSDGPPCHNGGRCLDRVNGFECICQGTGYRGARCEQDMDECAEAVINCQNGGTCTNTPGGYRCDCKQGFIGLRCHMADPCVPSPVTNQTVHNCVHGQCVRPRVMVGASGREFATHECDCERGYTGELCMHLVEAQQQMELSNFLGLGVVVLVLCIALGALLYLFVVCTRHKRANQGTYSPSSQEMTAQTASRSLGGRHIEQSGQGKQPMPIYHNNSRNQKLRRN